MQGEGFVHDACMMISKGSIKMSRALDVEAMNRTLNIVLAWVDSTFHNSNTMKSGIRCNDVRVFYCRKTGT